MQLRLNIGEFRYEESGLLDKTHLRFFTKQTIFEIFNETGFGITKIVPRIFPEPMRERFLPVIENFARLAEVDPKNSVADARPLQYVVRAVPM